jgi:hypothetical protein
VKALRQLRLGLLAEHLSLDEDDVAASIEAHGHVGAVRALEGKGRTLRGLPLEASPLANVLEPLTVVADPQAPLDPGELFREALFNPDDE